MANAIGSGNGKVGLKVVTADGPGVIEKLIGEDNAVVKLDSGFRFKGDLEHINEAEQESKPKKETKAEPTEETPKKTTKKKK